MPDSIIDELAKINKIVRGYQSDINIKPLNLIFRNDHGLSKIKKSNENDFYYLHQGASGYQSTIPIVLAIKYYSEIEKRKRTFIVEEPEINLFPSTQEKLMQYFLSAINDLLVAHKRGQQNEKETEKIIKKEAWLNPEDLSVYELKKGEAYDIFDKKLGLISDNIIDDVSDEMNDEFERLLDIK